MTSTPEELARFAGDAFQEAISMGMEPRAFIRLMTAGTPTSMRERVLAELVHHPDGISAFRLASQLGLSKDPSQLGAVHNALVTATKRGEARRQAVTSASPARSFRGGQTSIYFAVPR